MPVANENIKRILTNFDHHDPEFAEDPWPILDVMRESCPVLHSKAHGGMWVLTRYADVVRAARDHETFCSGEGILIGKAPSELPEECDPPEFFDYRRLLNPLLSPGAVQRWEPAILSTTTRLINSFIEAGACDLRSEFASPLPVVMTYMMLGIDAEAADLQLRQYIEATGRASSSEDLLHLAPVEELLQETIERRRKDPADDIISQLCQSRIRGRFLADSEIRDLARNIHNGGTSTTTDAICNALYCLGQRPDERRAIRDGRIDLPLAMEEILRFEAPVMSLARTATTDVEVHGKTIKAGEKVLLFWASANRDKSEFASPDSLQLQRNPNRHAAFGMGIHRCIGSNVARMTLRIAVQETLNRLPDYQIDYDLVRFGSDASTTYSKLTLPAIFTPGQRLEVP